MLTDERSLRRARGAFLASFHASAVFTVALGLVVIWFEGQDGNLGLAKLLGTAGLLVVAGWAASSHRWVNWPTDICAPAGVAS